MTPDEPGRLAFSSVTAAGRWCERPVDEAVTLFVETREVVVRIDGSGEELPAPLSVLSGASWRGGVLALHLAQETLHLRGGDGLDRAWHAVTVRACSLPEVTRGLRGLRASHGVRGDAQSRFFSPLLQARRRLEGEEPMDWKVAGFDAATLAERLRASLAAMALERHAERPPYRRAFEAGLLDASEQIFRQLEQVAAAAQVVHAGDDARRFVDWRSWAAEVRALFIQADRAWTEISAVIALEDRLHPSVKW